MSTSRYKAFISYSHADERWASWLQRRLEAFRDKRTDVVRHPLRPVFRDRSELAVGELGPAIEEALAASSALIVICSPAAAASEWVAAEIRAFRKLHGEPLILPLVVDAEPDAAYDAVFPEPLRYRGDGSEEKLELLAADLRPEKDGRTEAFLKIAAALLGTSFDSLRQRAQRARMRRLLAIAGGASVVAVGAVVLSVIALLARQDAEQRRSQAEDLVTFMIGDVRDELGGIGRLDLMEAVGEEALAYFQTLDLEELTPEAMLQRGRAIRQIGDVRSDQGELDAALELYGLAIETLDRLSVSPLDRLLVEQLTYERAQTHLARAGLSYSRGDIAESRADSTSYRNLIEALAKAHPENQSYLADLATADNNLGVLSFSAGDVEEAHRRFITARNSAEELIARQPGDPELQGLAAGIELWLGNVAERRGDDATARGHFDEALERERTAVRLDPAPGNREALARTLTIVSVANRESDLYLALEQAQEATELYRDLAAFEPDNATWQQRLNRSITITVGSELEVGCSPDIPGLLDEARHRAQALIDAQADTLETLRDRIDVDVLGARYALGIGSPADAELLAAAAFEGAGEVLEGNANDELSKRYLLRSAHALVRSRWLTGDTSRAGEAAAQALKALGADQITDPTAATLAADLRRVVAGDWSGWPPEPGRGGSRCDG